MAKNIIIGCMMLGILVLAQSAVGVQYDYELTYSSSSRDSGLREAVAMDDWLERGRSAVTESPIFPDGIRLTAWGGEDGYEPGLASAIYYFEVPRWAQYLKITIQYRDASRDDTIAGRLWIKSADRDQYERLGAGEEAPLYGDTFVLRSELNSETIIVPRSRHVKDDTVEMHIVAEGQDCLDVRDVRLVFLETRPGNLTVVHHTDNGYWDRWPRYRYAYLYYYWGPLFWPKTYVVYECWDVPSPFYWITWRPWFFINIIQVQHHLPWWGPRRYTVIYHVDVKQPPNKRKPLIHQRLKERNGYITKTIHPTPPTRKAVPPAMPDIRPRQQEVQLNKKSEPPRTVEGAIKRDPIQKNQQKQPVRGDRGQATQQSRVSPVKQEKAIQIPAQKQVKQPDSVDPKTDKSVRSTPPLRPDTRQLTQQKKAPVRSAVTKQPTTVKRPEVVNKPNARSARPSQTATQPGAVKQLPRSRSVARETPRGQTAAPAAKDHDSKQEETIRRDAKTGQRAKPQFHQEARQPRSYAEQQRHR